MRWNNPSAERAFNLMLNINPQKDIEIDQNPVFKRDREFKLWIKGVEFHFFKETEMSRRMHWNMMATFDGQKDLVGHSLKLDENPQTVIESFKKIIDPRQKTTMLDYQCALAHIANCINPNFIVGTLWAQYFDVPVEQERTSVKIHPEEYPRLEQCLTDTIHMSIGGLITNNMSLIVESMYSNHAKIHNQTIAETYLPKTLKSIKKFI